MELQAMAMGKYVGPASGADQSNDVQENMLAVEHAPGTKITESTHAGLQKRIQTAHQKANYLLKTSAILSDAYFLYTPAQIWLSAFMAADEPLATFYIETILDKELDIEDQLIETLSSCKELLTSKTSSKPDEQELVELRRIDKKLYKCRNPEKMDISAMTQPQKREGEGEDVEDDKVIKKRKLEREKTKADDMFGPAIGK